MHFCHIAASPLLTHTVMESRDSFFEVSVSKDFGLGLFVSRFRIGYFL